MGMKYSMVSMWIQQKPCASRVIHSDCQYFWAIGSTTIFDIVDSARGCLDHKLEYGSARPLCQGRSQAVHP